MRGAAAVVCALALVAGGCGGQTDAAAGADARVEGCVDRLLARGSAAGETGAARRYAAETYCRPFERQGWVYDDGTLAVDAHLSLAESGSEECEVATSAGRSRSVSCDELERDGSPLVLDCALLHHVRREEAQEYLADLRREHDVVRCDDGTPLDDLGAR